MAEFAMTVKDSEDFDLAVGHNEEIVLVLLVGLVPVGVLRIVRAAFFALKLDTAAILDDLFELVSVKEVIQNSGRWPVGVSSSSTLVQQDSLIVEK